MDLIINLIPFRELTDADFMAYRRTEETQITRKVSSKSIETFVEKNLSKSLID